METIEEFYNNQSIFITGGTGFLGKVLLEKLLRTCPNVGNIYFLCRPKKGHDIQKRIDEILQEAIFDNLKQITCNNKWRNKIIPIRGDISQTGLGLTKENEDLLKKSVNIVIHAAATVEFNTTFKQSLITNTRGTRELCNLALQMTNLKFLTYISTAYSNSNRKTINESLYLAPLNWRDAIKYAEVMDSYTMEVIGNKFIGNFKNYYTFSKALSEQIINELCNGKISTFIIRPSIILPAIEEPIPGWVDNFLGPMGMFIAAGKGILRTFRDGDNYLNLIPVDYVSRIILLVPYYHLEALRICNELVIYNACGTAKTEMSLRNFSLSYLKGSRKLPLEKPLGYPNVTFPSCILIYYVCLILYQLIPALLVDATLKLFGKKPFLFRLQAKLYLGSKLLQPFLKEKWTFGQSNVERLKTYLDDRPINGFDLIMHDFCSEENIINGTYCAKKYLLKEKMNLEIDLEYTRKMKMLSYGLQFCMLALLIYVAKLIII